MKFIFVDSYNLKWNGNTARYTTGISGSHNGHMYLAEGLAAANNEVIMVSTKNNIIEDIYNGVQYMNLSNFTHTKCSYIIIMNNIQSLEILNYITQYEKLLIIMQNDLCYISTDFVNIDLSKILICYISEFAKTNILRVQPFLQKYDNILLHNSIDMNDILQIKSHNNHNRDNYICYFACIDRGYTLVLEILKKLDNYKLLTNNYYTDNIYTNLDKNIIVTENKSKYEIFKNISKSKYFIYPLINLEDNHIHYDTFAYVVLEALLLGTIVIAPKIQVFVELYGDAVCYIDTSELIPEEQLLSWGWYNYKFGYPMIDRYVEKVKLLDNDPELRKTYIDRGRSINDKFSHIKISKELLLCKLYTTYQNHLLKLSNQQVLPQNHLTYLQKLKQSGFEPKVIYDIGSCVLHWTTEVKKLWPNAKIILFDAIDEVEFLYKDYDYYIGVLSDTDNIVVKFYQNAIHPGGNSYYREIGMEHSHLYFPETNYVEKITKMLDTIVSERSFPLPDFVKIDVQGAEVDIIRGGINTFKHASRMIVELQHVEYNKGALLNIYSLPIIETLLGMECTDPLFHNNGSDGDYGFININK
jgi:FkbM family methyltransferase